MAAGQRHIQLNSCGRDIAGWCRLGQCVAAGDQSAELIIAAGVGPYAFAVCAVVDGNQPAAYAGAVAGILLEAADAQERSVPEVHVGLVLAFQYDNILTGVAYYPAGLDGLRYTVVAGHQVADLPVAGSIGRGCSHRGPRAAIEYLDLPAGKRLAADIIFIAADAR